MRVRRRRTFVDVELGVVERAVGHVVRPVVGGAQVLLVDALPCQHEDAPRENSRQTQWVIHRVCVRRLGWHVAHR